MSWKILAMKKRETEKSNPKNGEERKENEENPLLPTSVHYT